MLLKYFLFLPPLTATLFIILYYNITEVLSVLIFSYRYFIYYFIL